ncbi:hypothetical protein MTP99_008446 [Tenebrio molitor]|nr:hypothetical protein MTP99_008446 [Tenebrio molitor]
MARGMQINPVDPNQRPLFPVLARAAPDHGQIDEDTPKTIYPGIAQYSRCCDSILKQFGRKNQPLQIDNSTENGGTVEYSPD